jgi:hypothetical protein
MGRVSDAMDVLLEGITATRGETVQHGLVTQAVGRLARTLAPGAAEAAPAAAAPAVAPSPAAPAAAPAPAAPSPVPTAAARAVASPEEDHALGKSILALYASLSSSGSGAAAAGEEAGAAAPSGSLVALLDAPAVLPARLSLAPAPAADAEMKAGEESQDGKEAGEEAAEDVDVDMAFGESLVAPSLLGGARGPAAAMSI